MLDSYQARQRYNNAMSKFARVGACILKVAFFYLTMNEIWKDVKGYEGKYQVSNLGRIRCLKNKRNKEGIMSLGEKRGYYIILVPNGKSRKNLFVHRLVAMAFIPNPLNKPYIDHINGDSRDNRVENLRWCTHKENMNNPITKQRIRDAMMGENNPFYGKTHREDTKSRISQSRMGKYRGEENPFYGKTHREDTKSRISQSRMGKYRGEENPFYGKKHTLETKAIMSQKKKERGGIPIVQMSKEGEIIKVWEHASIAGKTLNISPSSITECCRGKRKSIGGYIWKYESIWKSNL